ncbi:type II toxin-antitoxin system ParD family antitoxin [Sphingomonas sp. RT2P30]|uniref:ribbon-helix-helix domain-containing protein n=1 Tax=Parasphingomonas halimpatiens TaxID=3096162 RepID=UPI002FC82DC4
MTQLTISMPAALQSWVESRISEGTYADAADYLRDLIRHDQEQNDRRWIRAMIDEGLASGVIERDGLEVFDEVIAEDPELRA